MSTSLYMASTMQLLAGVTSVEVETVKPGVVRLRVTGGFFDVVKTIAEMVRAVGTSMVLEHRADEQSRWTETFL